MRATLTKKIKVNSALAYLTIEREQERPDIVEYLQWYRERGRGYDNELIEERVREHLRGLRILDEKGRITDKGELIMESGKLFVREEGKYRIWYTRRDPFFGDTIFHLSRHSPKKDEQRLELEEVHFYGEISTLLPIEDAASIPIRPIAREKDSKELIYSEKREQRELTLEWEWDCLDSSSYRISGQVSGKAIREHSFKAEDKNLKREIRRFFGDDWNGDYERLAIRELVKLDKRAKKDFATDYELTEQLHFERLSFRDIPLMPYNAEVARQWRDWLLESALNERYYLSYDFESLCKETNSKKGFEAFEDELELPEVDPFREQLYNRDRQRQAKSYWHLTAPFDLNPDSEKGHLLTAFSFNPGEQTTFREIVNRLRGSDRVKALFYFDKYASTIWQQRRLAALFEAFGEMEVKELITRTQLNERSDYLERNCPEVEQVDIGSIFSREKPNHSRYIVYLNERGEIVVWGLNHSIDFIKFKENDIKPDSLGVTEDVAFERHKIEMLKSELRGYINDRIREVI